jgi:hypothetical protein
MFLARRLSEMMPEGPAATFAVHAAAKYVALKWPQTRTGDNPEAKVRALSTNSTPKHLIGNRMVYRNFLRKIRGIDRHDVS